MRPKDVALALVFAASLSVFSTKAETPAAQDTLFKTVAALDTAVFESFNHCADPAQLEKHASFFAPDVEFYHDNGGVTWTREEMLANTRKFVCGKFRRELVSDSLSVYPIKGFGAIAQGTHRFCQFSGNTCEGMADFTMVWRETDGKWEITRALSYGHRANDDHADIRQVIESFRTAIIQRDKARFLALFLPGHVTWQAVMQDESLARVQKKRPEAIKVRVNPDSTPVSFADGFSKPTARWEETFSNIKIDSDGDVASVTFDYTFRNDGKETNFGKENWLLVRTGGGWKITSVIYSVTLTPEA